MSEELDLLSDSRPIRYVETGVDGAEVVIYRASSIGTCERALVASARKALAQPHPDWFQQVLDEGTANESVISAMWDAETGIPTVDQQREFNLLIGEIDGRDVYVRSHVDGLNGADDTSIREYKKFRDSTWPKFLEQGVEVGANYPWQVSVAMHALSGVTSGGVVACEFVGGHFAGDDTTGRSITEVACKYLAIAPIPLAAIRAKVARVERLINQGFDTMEVPCDARMYPCPYYRYHDPKKQLDERVIETDEEWVALIGDYEMARSDVTNARKVMDAHDARAKGLRQQIMDRLHAVDVAPGSHVTVGDRLIKWVEMERAAYEVKATTVVKVDVGPVPVKKAVS